MSKVNIGKICNVGLCLDEYEIISYSEKVGKKYLVRAIIQRDDTLYYGWVDASEVKIKNY